MTLQTATSVVSADQCSHRWLATKTVAMMKGPPTRYTAELADRILHELSEGRLQRDICRDGGMPGPSTVRDWVSRDREGFAARYHRACEIGRAVTGRAAPYTAELAKRILRELSGGRSLGDVCRDGGMPTRGTVRQWVIRDHEGFAARYNRAREIGQAPTGRRVALYTAETAERILSELSVGRSLHEVCRDYGMPAPSTVRKWEIEDRHGFAARYSAARQFGYDIRFDEIIDIADDTRGDWTWRIKADGSRERIPNRENIRRTRLRLKVRCWLLSKTLPKIHGDRRSVRMKTRCRR
jgi:transposase-like protein